LSFAQTVPSAKRAVAKAMAMAIMAIAVVRPQVLLRCTVADTGKRKLKERPDNQLRLDERQRRLQNAVGERRSLEKCRRVEPVQISGQLRHGPAADLLRHRLLPRSAGRTQAHTQGTYPAVAHCSTGIQRGLRLHAFTITLIRIG